jgi:hypothetical protein
VDAAWDTINKALIRSYLERVSSLELGIMVHNCNASTWEAKAGGLPVRGQPGLHLKKKKESPLLKGHKLDITTHQGTC